MDVSIITPLHNGAEFIEETIVSVLNQTFQSWEMIIVDDCSTDESVNIVQSFVNRDSRIRLVQLDKNSGAAVARNLAIELSVGQYIAFLDSDDIWLPNKLEVQISFMQQNNYPFSFSAYEKIDESGKVFASVSIPKAVTYRDLLKVCSIGCLTAIYSTEKLGKVYMPLIRKRQDLGLWLRLLKKTKYAYGIDMKLARYRVRKDSISANKLNAASYTWRLYRDVEKLPLIKAVYYFAFYAVNGVIRTKMPRLAKVLGY